MSFNLLKIDLRFLGGGVHGVEHSIWRESSRYVYIGLQKGHVCHVLEKLGDKCSQNTAVRPPWVKIHQVLRLSSEHTIMHVTFHKGQVIQKGTKEVSGELLTPPPFPMLRYASLLCTFRPLPCTLITFIYSMFPNACALVWNSQAYMSQLYMLVMVLAFPLCPVNKRGAPMKSDPSGLGLETLWTRNWLGLGLGGLDCNPGLLLSDHTGVGYRHCMQ